MHTVLTLLARKGQFPSPSEFGDQWCSPYPLLITGKMYRRLMIKDPLLLYDSVYMGPKEELG